MFQRDAEPAVVGPMGAGLVDGLKTVCVLEDFKVLTIEHRG